MGRKIDLKLSKKDKIFQLPVFDYLLSSSEMRNFAQKSRSGSEIMGSIPFIDGSLFTL